MNAGHDSDVPDRFGGVDRYRQQAERPEDPYAVGADPYAAGPRSSDRYAVGAGTSDPYASDPYRFDQNAFDPYAGDPRSEAATAPDWSQAQPPAGPHSMGPPQYGAFQAPLPSSSAAITGFVLGVVGLALCGGLTSPVGIFFAAKGMKETAPTASPMMGGRGLAIAGLVTSLVGLIPLLLMLFYIVVMVLSIVASATA